ncbi:MAG: hypothetical protein AAF726_18425 [Planctomycetota bacterium]
MSLSLTAALAVGDGSLSTPSLAAGIGAVAALSLLLVPLWRERPRRYGDVAVGVIVVLAAIAVAARGGAREITDPAAVAGIAVALVALGAGRTFGRGAAVWAACLVAVVYGSAAPTELAEPVLVAWTGLWMAAAAPRVRGPVTLGLATLAAVPPLAVAAATEPGLAILSTLLLLPASALAGALIPGGVARVGGAAALAVAAVALFGAEPEPEGTDRPAVAFATIEAVEGR